MSNVYQANCRFVDSDQNAGTVLFFGTCTSLPDALSQIATRIQYMQSCSLAFFQEAIVCFSASFGFTLSPPSGSLRRQLLILCRATRDPNTGNIYPYKLRLPAPDPACLTHDGTALDVTSIEGAILYNHWITLTTDVKGNPFHEMIKTAVVTI